MLNLAIIGTSWITKSFVDAALSTKEYKLVAVYSRSLATASQFAEEYKLGKDACYTSIDEMCKDAKVQVVYIASPNSLHFEQAKQVLSHGKHAIVEKPCCSNTLEFIQLERIAQQSYKETGAMCIEAFRHIQEKNFKVLKDSLPKLGKIYMSLLPFASFSSRYTDILEGRLAAPVFSADFSGGCLLDTGVYPISFAIRLWGKPKSQQYFPYMIPQTGTDGGGTILLVYDWGIANIVTSKIFTSKATVEIYGEKGTLRANAITDLDSIEFVGNAKGTQAEQLAGPKESFNLAEEATEFARIIRDNDIQAAADLWQVSSDVMDVMTDLRKQNGIVFAAER
ncbi:oxidoreductase domain-containing protein [Protomyces lactucae-debilis]|uniref:Oxidoreductase domain-containing protein n=1 Tax=Protomyces lactucae-debilis TaxID=2754530 RepID=A0A1Y2FUJ0_PROLT|nr:oxidoreductase domain-containing protein [Protomyces lactucae-debilis]ORY87680.1 oxidoreductase domain-containing protein [Protomyces lactucae-debilis]